MAIAIVSTAIVSCQKEKDTAVTGNQVHFILNAQMPETKTGIMYDDSGTHGAYVPYWQKNDEIGVLFALPSAGDLTPDAVFANTQNDGAAAAFEGDVTISEGTDITFYSYYPASAGAKVYGTDVKTIGLDIPSNQSPVYDATFGYSFDPKADLLIAQPSSCIVAGTTGANSVDMYFARVSGVLRVELNAATTAAFYGEVVKSFKIETSSGDIAGRVAVNPVTGEYDKTNSRTGSKSITATYDVSACPVYVGYASTNNVFLGVAPVTIPAGSTLTFTIETVDATSGADAHKLVKTISSTPKDIVFKSSKPSVIRLSLADDNIFGGGGIEYTLVKDAADLTVGSEVIIAAAEADYALGTNQTTNNRSAVAQAKSTDGQTITGPGATVQLLTIADGNKAGTIAFYTGTGYLCAASSGSNYLRTETDLSDESSWSVDISSAGVASIVAQGSYTRNVMQYNSGSAIFACYASDSQKPVAIYKRSTPDTRTEVTLSFGTASYNLSIGTPEYGAFVGQTVTTNPTGVSGVKYALKGDAIGTVNENTGAVTLDGSTVGTATITASFNGDASYKPATSVSYTITVDDPNAVDYVTLDWTYPASGDATLAGLTAIDGVEVGGLGTYGDTQSPYCIKLDDTGDYIQIKTDSAIDEVSISYKMVGGNTASTITISESSDGSTWSDVESLSIAGAQNSTGVLKTLSAFDSASRYVKMTFTKGSNVGIGGITITKADPTPRFTVDSPLEATKEADDYVVSVHRKNFTDNIMVSTPTTCDWVFAGDVAAGESTFNVHVNANTGAARSVTLTLSGTGVESRELVINQAGNDPGTEANPYSVAQAIDVAGALANNATTANDVYVSGVVSTVETYFTSYKSISYYISADGTTTSQLLVYSGKGLNGADFSDIADLAIGDQVVVKGKLKNYNSTLEFNTSSQIVVFNPTTRYTVTLGSVTNGSISASATSVGAQSVVTLTASPNSGYELDKWTVTKEGTTEEVAVDSEGKFIMPAADVSVLATFKVSTSTGGGTASFVVSDFSGQGTTSTGSAISVTKSGITFACDKGYGTTQIRCYKDGTITISAESGKTITGISFTFSSTYTGGLNASYTGLSTSSWSQKLGSQARLTAISVTYE